MQTKVSSYLTGLGFRQIQYLSAITGYNNKTGGEFVVVKENNRIYRFERNSTLPMDNINVLATADGGDTRWIAVGGGAMTQYRIAYTFEEESNTIPLGMTVLSKSNIFYINIENTQILSSEFNLNEAKNAVILSKSFEPGVQTEVVIFTGDYQPNERDYELTNNKPQINGVELVGNRSLAQLGIQPAGDYATNTSLNEDVAKLVDEKADKATTLAGYNITDAYTKNEVDVKIAEKDSLPLQPGNEGKFLTTDGTVASWKEIPAATTSVLGLTKLATDEEITEGTSETSVVVAKQLANTNTNIDTLQTNLNASNQEIETLKLTKANNATTLLGYGIENAYTKDEVDNLLASVNTNLEELNTEIATKATQADTLAGYGITDAYNTVEIDNALNTKQDNLTAEQLEAVNSTITADKLNALETGIANTYTKEEIDTSLNTKADKQEVNILLNTKANKSDVYTKDEANDLFLNDTDTSTFAKTNKDNEFTVQQTINDAVNIKLNTTDIGESGESGDIEPYANVGTLSFINPQTELTEAAISAEVTNTKTTLKFDIASVNAELIGPEHLQVTTNKSIPNVQYLKDTIYTKEEVDAKIVDTPDNVVTSNNYVNASLWKGTLAEYEALGEYDDSITYFVTDDDLAEGVFTDDYNQLKNKPSVAGIELTGNKTLSELGLYTKDEVNNMIASLTNQIADLQDIINNMHLTTNVDTEGNLTVELIKE